LCEQWLGQSAVCSLPMAKLDLSCSATTFDTRQVAFCPGVVSPSKGFPSLTPSGWVASNYRGESLRVCSGGRACWVTGRSSLELPRTGRHPLCI
jgi:hypothetical protein